VTATAGAWTAWPDVADRRVAVSEQLDAAAHHGLAGLLGAAVLDVDGAPLTGRDLLAAGIASGRWQELERTLSEGLGLVAAAPPDDAAIATEVRELRTARGLLSADDMRAWMRARGLTVAEFRAVAARTVARRNGGTPHPVLREEVCAALAAEAILGGTLTELGLWLADRMLAAGVTDAEVAPLSLERLCLQRLVHAEASSITGASTGETGTERARRLGWVAALDDAQRAWARETARPEALARAVREHELDWCRFELDILALDTPGAAAEAARRLAEGAAPHDVAAMAGSGVSAVTLMLVDAPRDLAQALTGAVTGDVVGPWEQDDQRLVALVRKRRLPVLDDEETRTHATSQVLIEAAERLRAGRIRWHERA
jgi:hypothetical protein